MNVLTLPVVATFSFLTALLFGLAAQRLLGVRLGLVRLFVAGVFALFVNWPIQAALLGDFAEREPTRADAVPVVFFILLAMACTVLASMAFLVVIEAFFPLGSLPPPLVWGRGLRARLARTRRYWQIVGVALRHGLGPFVRDTRRPDDSAGRDRQLGRALRKTLDAGGVTFVKLGQVLSTRRDLLPVEVVDELSSLQDRARPVPWTEVEAVLEAELGAPLDEVFAGFDRTPLAAASVGQVHAAWLRSGAEVVVKVQRPGIRPAVERDLDIAQRIAGRLEEGTAWGRSIGVRTLADGLATAIREELDYRIEAENLRTVASGKGRTSAIHVPEIHQQLCTERVLVMQRLHGTPVNAVARSLAERALDRPAMARTLLDYLLRQMLLDGVFHADPHAGNVLVLDDGRIGLLDFGSVGRVDAGLRDALQRLLLAVDRADPLGTSDALLELVPRPEVVDQQRLERDLGRFLARHIDTAAASSVRMFADLFRIVSHHGLSIPPELAAVFRALGTVEGTLEQLAPGFEFVAEARQLAGSYVTERLRPDAVRQAAGEELVALLPILRRFPRRVERIANAAEHGRLGLNVRLFADERDREVVTDLLHQVLLAFLAATVGVMAVLLLGTGGGPMVTETVSLYALFGYNLLVVSAVLGLRVLAAIFRRS
ncbi:MAG TPA: AarF/UbiB family protein [Jiangellaceae bacterium]|nr:AarF/UbiB family protein [Jiangellaceae bacterium]